MEFRIATGWRIFIYLISPLFFGLGIWMIYTLLFSEESGELLTNILTFILAITTISFSLYSLLRAFKVKLAIQKDRLTYQLVFKTKTFLVKDIDGFKVDESYFQIVSKSNPNEVFKISRYIANNSQFLDYLYENFDDLTISNQAKEASFILENEKFGANKAEREKTFDRAKNIVKALNACMVILAILVIAFPHPWDIVVLLNLSLPPIGIFLVIRFRGIVQLDGKKDSLLPHVSYLILFPVIVVNLRIALDMGFLALSNLWIPSFVLTFLFSLFVFFKTDQLNYGNHIERITLGVFVIIIFLYSICLVLTFNFILDSTEPKLFNVEVLDKRESDSAYYLELDSGWLPLAKVEIEGTVSSDFYRKIISGDSVTVEFREGAFNIPWFQIIETSFQRTGERNFNFSLPDTLVY